MIATFYSSQDALDLTFLTASFFLVPSPWNFFLSDEIFLASGIFFCFFFNHPCIFSEAHGPNISSLFTPCRFDHASFHTSIKKTISLPRSHFPQAVFLICCVHPFFLLLHLEIKTSLLIVIPVPLSVSASCFLCVIFDLLFCV